MVDRHVVQVRIGKIREYVALLRRIRRGTTPAGFVRDPLVYGNAERYLQLAIQSVLDISNHILADSDSRLPRDNKELFELLASRKVLPTRLARKLTAMAGFRNILVHEYLEIDRRRVYEILRDDLGDFDRFIRAVSKLL